MAASHPVLPARGHLHSDEGEQRGPQGDAELQRREPEYENVQREDGNYEYEHDRISDTLCDPHLARRIGVELQHLAVSLIEMADGGKRLH